MNRIFLHLDMDAFFASVEQRDRPELIGKPVIIGPNPHKGELRGVVSTCSYEARKFGVHSAMPVAKAFQLCPNGIYLHGNFKAYKTASKQIFELMKTVSPEIQPISIDEAFLDITGSIKLFGSVEAIIVYLKKEISEKVGLSCSIGVAPRKFIAKIASDYRKPNGFTIVEEDHILPFLAHLPIEKLWGIGKKTLERFNQLGISHVHQLQQLSEHELASRFGKMGTHLFRLVHGIDPRVISKEREMKSVSKEHTFRTDTTDLEQISTKLYVLAEEVSQTIRNKNFYGKTVNLKFRVSGFQTFSRSKTFSNSIRSHIELYSIGKQLLNEFYPFQKGVRLIGIGVSHPDETFNQISAFEFESDKQNELDKVKDKLNSKFGKKTIFGAEGMGNQLQEKINT